MKQKEPVKPVPLWIPWVTCWQMQVSDLKTRVWDHQNTESHVEVRSVFFSRFSVRLYRPLKKRKSCKDGTKEPSFIDGGVKVLGSGNKSLTYCCLCPSCNLNFICFFQSHHFWAFKSRLCTAPDKQAQLIAGWYTVSHVSTRETDTSPGGQLKIGIWLLAFSFFVKRTPAAVCQKAHYLNSERAGLGQSGWDYWLQTHSSMGLDFKNKHNFTLQRSFPVRRRDSGVCEGVGSVVALLCSNRSVSHRNTFDLIFRLPWRHSPF